VAGSRYPCGIPIVDEDDLELTCRRESVEEVVFAYSDVEHASVMHLASRALAAGADFTILGPHRTMLRARVPVIAISAIRTGCGKSQTARWLGRRLRDRGRRVAVLRHPMPYGDLEGERVQRFTRRSDLDAAKCTAEEREEYEPHLDAGNVVFAGVDYAAIVAAAEKEADIIVWDGGNNDFPFLVPDLHIVMADALRPGQVAAFHPGEAVARMADVVVINKVDAAPRCDVERVTEEFRVVNQRATIVRAASPVRLDDPAAVRGRRVLVVEDGPTITHGGMPHGAGYVAATEAGADTIVDPRASAAPFMATVFERYPHIGRVLPAVGYSGAQLEALRESINGARADVVVAATPIDLAALIAIDKPVVRARYDFADAGEPTLGSVVDAFLARIERGRGSA
jgi:predicted GTPase